MSVRPDRVRARIAAVHATARRGGTFADVASTWPLRRRTLRRYLDRHGRSDLWFALERNERKGASA